MYLLVQTGLFGIELQVAPGVDEQVAEYLYPGAVGRYDVYAVYAGVFDCLGASRLITSPSVASISPVPGAMTFSAAVRPWRREAMESFLLNL